MEEVKTTFNPMITATENPEESEDDSIWTEKEDNSFLPVVAQLDSAEGTSQCGDETVSKMGVASEPEPAAANDTNIEADALSEKPEQSLYLLESVTISTPRADTEGLKSIERSGSPNGKADGLESNHIVAQEEIGFSASRHQDKSSGLGRFREHQKNGPEVDKDSCNSKAIQNLNRDKVDSAQTKDLNTITKTQKKKTAGNSSLKVTRLARFLPLKSNRDLSRNQANWKERAKRDNITNSEEGGSREYRQKSIKRQRTPSDPNEEPLNEEFEEGIRIWAFGKSLGLSSSVPDSIMARQLMEGSMRGAVMGDGDLGQS